MNKPLPMPWLPALVAGLLFAAGSVQAQNPQGINVVAQITDGETSVGNPVQLQISVAGAPTAGVPREIRVNGLDIRYSGQTTKVQMLNFRMSSIVTYLYTVTPLVAGEFVIPSQEIQVGGRTYRTAPIRLSVAGGSGAPPSMQPPPLPGMPQPPPPTQQNLPQSAAEVAFAELIVPKESAYVGELIPVELRFYFDSNFRFQLEEKPQFGGEGFTVHQLGDHKQLNQKIQGRDYRVISFQTAISPLKSGKLEIPPAQMNATVFGLGQAPFGFDDFFQRFMGQQIPPAAFGGSEDIVIKSEPTTLEVKALPKDGRPADFSGAVGEFSLAASRSPEKAAPGDPVTLKLVVSGQGNFQAMGAPELTQTDGWRTYPPKESFDASDKVGFSGKNTFEYLLVAAGRQSATPGSKFSYFDPRTEKYVTLETAPIPVQAEGAAAAAQSPVPAQDQSPPQEFAAASPSSAPADRAMTTARFGQSFRPLSHHPWYLAAQGIALAILAALAAAILLRRLLTSPASHARREQKETRRQIDHLERLRTSEKEFYASARQILSRISEGEVHRLDRELDPNTSETVRQIVEIDDFYKYGGDGRSADKQPDETERQAVAKALRNLSRSYGK